MSLKQFAGCKGRKTSAIILKKQLLPAINQERVIRPSGKHSRQLFIFPGVEVPASSSQCQTV